MRGRLTRPTTVNILCYTKCFLEVASWAKCCTWLMSTRCWTRGSRRWAGARSPPSTDDAACWPTMTPDRVPGGRTRGGWPRARGRAGPHRRPRPLGCGRAGAVVGRSAGPGGGGRGVRRLPTCGADGVPGERRHDRQEHGRSVGLDLGACGRPWPAACPGRASAPSAPSSRRRGVIRQGTRPRQRLVDRRGLPAVRPWAGGRRRGGGGGPRQAGRGRDQGGVRQRARRPAQAG